MVQGLQLSIFSSALYMSNTLNLKLFSTEGLPFQESTLKAQRSPQQSRIMEKGPTREVF